MYYIIRHRIRKFLLSHFLVVALKRYEFLHDDRRRGRRRMIGKLENYLLENYNENILRVKIKK